MAGVFFSFDEQCVVIAAMLTWVGVAVLAAKDTAKFSLHTLSKLGAKPAKNQEDVRSFYLFVTWL